jgi:hypothetical protein
MLPTIIERTARGEYSIDPYSKLLADRIVFLGTRVDDVSANDGLHCPGQLNLIEVRAAAGGGVPPAAIPQIGSMA